VTQDLTDISDAHKRNWANIIAFGLFHLGAIAALFMFSWRALAVAVFLYWMLYRPRHQHGIPPAAHAQVLPGACGA
jgi:hypothetical protein